MEDTESSPAREQLLKVAGALFSEKGYSSVTLKDIAQALGVRQAALYYHVPEGKEQLFVEVMARNFQRHSKGIEQALAQAEPHFIAQLKALANWLLSQPPLDMARLARSDLPSLSEKNAQYLYNLGNVLLMEPIRQVITKGYQQGEIRLVDVEVIGTAFLSMIDTLHDMNKYKGIPKEVLAQDLIEILFEGLRRR
jgi:AcrR family transcriptional regulator